MDEDEGGKVKGAGIAFTRSFFMVNELTSESYFLRFCIVVRDVLPPAPPGGCTTRRTLFPLHDKWCRQGYDKHLIMIL